ncbi:MAPEG family protein [Pseudoduganella sp. OTU4001]|uniref:MAPEG family protein n=1 Tax=Pseudoduganella sp. OTU4001 TaxID=3043854 RepID=UPI00313DEDB3
MQIPGIYAPTLWAMGSAGALLLLQLIVADLVAIRSGHRAGTPIPPDFNKFLFRAARAHANTNESIAAFTLFAIAGILSGASPAWLNALAWAYLACRLAHMASYYANKKAARSTAFGISLLVLLGMFAANLIAWM